MAALIVPNAYLCSIEGTSGGQPVTNVIGIEKGFSSAALVAAAVEFAWLLPVGPINVKPTAYTYNQVSVTDLSTADGDVAVKVNPTPGRVTGQLATNGSCALVSYGSGTRSRSSAGRMYFGPLPETMIEADGRTTTNNARILITDAMLEFQESLAGFGFTWSVISRTQQRAYPIDPARVGVQTIIATQRRRIRSR